LKPSSRFNATGMYRNYRHTCMALIGTCLAITWLWEEHLTRTLCSWTIRNYRYTCMALIGPRAWLWCPLLDPCCWPESGTIISCKSWILTSINDTSQNSNVGQYGTDVFMIVLCCFLKYFYKKNLNNKIIILYKKKNIYL